MDQFYTVTLGHHTLSAYACVITRLNVDVIARSIDRAGTHAVSRSIWFNTLLTTCDVASAFFTLNIPAIISCAKCDRNLVKAFADGEITSHLNFYHHDNV